MALSTFICMRAWHECQMFTRVLLLTLNLKIKKKVDAIRSSFVLTIVVRIWRILKSIFAIFCFITSKKERKQLKQGKSCVEFTVEMSLKNASVRTGSPDSVMVIFQSKTLIAPVDFPKLTMMKWKHWCKQISNKHSTVRELAIALKVSVKSVHGQFEIARLRKEARCLGTAWVERIWWIAWASAINSSNAKKTIRSWSVWSRVTKNGLFTTMSAEKEVGNRRSETPERQAKTEIHQKKVILSMWWDWKGPVFYELLPKNKTINSDVYCEQLQKLSDAIAQKCPRANQS